MDLTIPRHIVDEIIAHARELAPHECCGLLAGRADHVTRLYRIRNIIAMDGVDKQSQFDPDKAAHLQRLSPEERAEVAFVMDMQEFSYAKKDIRKQGLDLQVIYHSHPKDPARPSVTDIKIATDYEDVWHQINLPVPAYLLISLMKPDSPDVRTYWIRGGAVTPADVLII
jgi:proteasome lid subunit RPN8/RPN11